MCCGRTFFLPDYLELLNQKERIGKEGGRNAGNVEQWNKRIAAAIRINPHHGISRRCAGGHREPAISPRGSPGITQRIEQRPQINAVSVARARVEPIDRVTRIRHRRVHEQIISSRGCWSSDVGTIARAHQNVGTGASHDGIVARAAIDDV